MRQKWMRFLVAGLLAASASVASAETPIMTEIPTAPARPTFLSGGDLGTAAVDYLAGSGRLDHLGSVALKVSQIAEGPETTLIVFGLVVDGLRVVEHSTFIVVDPTNWQVLAISSRANSLPPLSKGVRKTAEQALGVLDDSAELVYFTDMEGTLRLSWMGTVRRADERRMVVADAITGALHFDALIDSGATDSLSLTTKSEVPGKPTLRAEQTSGNDFLLEWTGSGSVQNWKIYKQTSSLPNFQLADLFFTVENTINRNFLSVWVTQKTWWWVQGCNFFGCGQVSNAVATSPQNMPL